MSIPVIKDQAIISNIKVTTSHKRWTLNFTDIINNSNKFYNAEIVESSDGKFYLFTNYGRVGGTAAKEYRQCQSLNEAEKEADKIIKSKTKKGYVEVKLVRADVGSDVGKSKVEASIISEKDAVKAGYKINEESASTLHPQVQSLIKFWFGSIEKFVIDTIDTSKCALGQLSIDQINKGRDLLLEARKLVGAKKLDLNEINNVSSKYYSNIPMNFGYRKLDADQLRFDTNDKLDIAFDILDTLEGAKDAEKVINKKNAVDEQYKSLKCDLEWVDPQEEAFKWVDLLFHQTRASNHHFLGKIKIHNLYRLIRNKEQETYFSTLENMAKKGQGRQDLPNLIAPLWNRRILENKEYEKLYNASNVLPLFHGSRTQNFPKIIGSQLKMRLPGFTVAGSMYDGSGGLYFGFSSKAINYSSFANSYWANGSDDKGYLFLSDVALGKQKVASGAYPYTAQGIAPCMSVWAKGGLSGVVNDEFIVYREDQNWLRYVIEFGK